jgi:hypothetical protein
MLNESEGESTILVQNKDWDMDLSTCHEVILISFSKSYTAGTMWKFMTISNYTFAIN